MTNEEKTSKANKHIGTNKSKRKIKGQERDEPRGWRCQMQRKTAMYVYFQNMSAWAGIVTDVAGMYEG